MKAVLRLGHRPGRDRRMTTHVGLTARAFGLEKMYLPDLDSKLKETLGDVSDRFGGVFSIEEEKKWKELIENWEGDTVHLTMYGSKIDDFFSENEIEDPLIVVGAEKVPKEVYDLVDHNVSVGNQPHSEVAALAVFMDRYNDRTMPEISQGKIGILPSSDHKRIVERSDVPSADECFEMAKEEDMDDDLLKHSMAVLNRALELQEKHGGDLQLIIAGALLHDIGRTVTHGIEHGVEGSRLIEEKGWDEELQKIVERHIGGGITKEEAREQGLPARNYLPESIEEKIICHADNTAGGKERFEEMIDRTKESGYEDSGERMKELAEEFEEDL
ncbi:MAG: HDIG domain-containing protein [Candidatus Thermoplasmatota archaeon]|nr:HDIG domain-containing protein [Candidatus Thermoplasmatota archaeon]